jgi:hypothetical protein
VSGTKPRHKPPRKPNPVHRPDYVAFVAVLRQLRGEMTLRELALKMGRPRTWVHKCDTGQRRMDVPEFIEWCTACGVDLVTAAKLLRRPR